VVVDVLRTSGSYGATIVPPKTNGDPLLIKSQVTIEAAAAAYGEVIPNPIDT
jgi:hypothetical protein